MARRIRLPARRNLRPVNTTHPTVLAAMRELASRGLRAGAVHTRDGCLYLDTWSPNHAELRPLKVANYEQPTPSDLAVLNTLAEAWERRQQNTKQQQQPAASWRPILPKATSMP